MDRYITREPRMGTEYPEGNQTIALSTPSTGNNVTIPQPMYYNPYANPVHNPEMQYSAVAMLPQMQTYIPNEYQPMRTGHIMPTYDHRYLAYPDRNAAYITGQIHTEPNSIATNAFGGDYHNRNFIGADRTENKQYYQQPRIANAPEPFNDFPKPVQKSFPENVKNIQKELEVTPKKKTETDLLKSEVQNEVRSRADKLKELHKTGTRVFCGTIENVLKWHKMIQDIGVTVLYEIVGKCVSIRAGESRAKNLVVRDENGPAIQVVYYEVDFFLPKLHVPCNVRVVGRILYGSSRLHAFSVRACTGDDSAMLPRRAAVAAHHVAKLCTEYADK